ncbi:S8 family serine peptidase [Streptomyces sp. AcE210]|uniref:S8 family serine peptidase n=1 Tax=Streptomyces sp. AcE210 TaxID=2292703 RepID=UPI000E301B66|nr:S8 family serine peptidase [Streptomyces sp. AcE210]RFC76022.1 peptidase S8 [Streptomyces sp. AcE210]
MHLPRPPRRRSASWAAAAFTATALAAGVIPAVAADTPSAAATAKVDSALSSAVAKGGEAKFFVVLKDKADLTTAKKQRTHAKAATAAYKALKTTAEDSQKSLTAFLDKEKVGHKDYWIANTVQVTGDQDLVNELAKRSDVEKIVKLRTFKIDAMETDDSKVTKSRTDSTGTASSAEGDTAPTWGLSDIKADQVWDQYGDRGEGIVVASVDTGVQYDHPDLVKQYRGNNGDGTFTNDYNFYDPTGNCSSDGTPCDNNGHGTHTMGTMVGKNGIGVAPNAKWIAAKGCGTSSCSSDDLLAAGQWILAPTDHNGQNPRPDLAPNIVNNSWGNEHGVNPFYEDIIDAWNSAGIFEAFAAGNFGDGVTCSTTDPPGAQVSAYGVGAYDSTGTIADFTGFGPSRIDGSMKPNITAPGVDVTSAWPDSSYNTIDGTSMATPHVAGAVALLWSAAPSLIGNIDETRKLLDEGATDVDDTHCGGTADANNVWGNGKLDILASVAKAPQNAVTVTGKVTSKATGEGLSGVTVKVTGADGTRNVTTSPDGSYRLAMTPGSYDISYTLYGYATGSVTGLAVVAGKDMTQDIALDTVPAHDVTGTVLDVTGKPLAGATVTVNGVPTPSVTTDAGGKFSFAKVAEGSYTVSTTPAAPVLCNGDSVNDLTVDGDESVTVKLQARADNSGNSCAPATYSWINGSSKVSLSGDEDAKSVTTPFPVKLYGVSYSSVGVSTNGLIDVLAPRVGDYKNQELASTDQPNGVVAPLWDDLTLDKKSSVQTATTGTTGSRKFAIVWNNVLFSDGTTNRATFEAVFDEATGAITFQYKSVPGKGASATIGIENQAGTDALQYSYNQAVVTDGSAIRIAQGAQS